MKCFLFFLFNTIYAEEISFLSGQDKITVIADRAYRQVEDSYLEAIGNVIITQKGRSLYGERAIIKAGGGEISMQGNVRYVNEGMNIYGNNLEYNSIKDEMLVTDARIISNDFIIIGKKILQKAGGNFNATEAEFTTCKDCPESWSFYGDEVNIDRDGYVVIKNVYVKIRGIVFLYLPIIIIPIKTKRESGILPPRVGLDFKNGINFQLPLYWAISDYQDLTISPTIWGEDGKGASFEYRYNYRQHSFLDLNAIYIKDNFYQKSDRYFISLEQHLANINHNMHLKVDHLSDLDMPIDYEDDFLISPTSEVTKSIFYDYRHSLFTAGIESSYNHNMVTADSFAFDQEYVQILPKLTVSLMPLTLFENKYSFFKNIVSGFDLDDTNFRPRTSIPNGTIKHANRLTATPYLQTLIYTNKYFQLNNRLSFNYQYYYLPLEESNFYKYFYNSETDLSFRIERIFGIAYLERISKDDIIWNNLPTLPSDKLIGTIPDYDQIYAKEYVEQSKDSYKHVQEFHLKHYYSSNLEYAGNNSFYEQLKNYKTIFDYTDFIADASNSLDDITSAKEIPKGNTLEIVWNNFLIRKRATTFSNIDPMYLSNNYAYDNILKFNISQGFNIDNEDSFLTRLRADGAFALGNAHLNYAAYYFYQSNDKIIDLDISHEYKRGRLAVGHRYNSMPVYSNNYLTASIYMQLTDTFTIDLFYAYDFNLSKNPENGVMIQYRPHGNCWQIQFKRYQNDLDTRYSINLNLNLGSNFVEF